MIFFAGLVSTFFLDEIFGDPLEFRLANKTSDTVYVKSKDVDSYSGLEEIEIKTELYQIVPPGNELVLAIDYTWETSFYMTNYYLNSPKKNFNIIVRKKEKPVFMSDFRKLKSYTRDGKRVFVRELIPNDIK